MAENLSVLASVNAGNELNIELITVIFLYPVVLGSLPLMGPVIDTAQLDIKKLYPKLNVTQLFVKSSPQFRSCFDWSLESENILAKFYYDRRQQTEQEPFTMFVMTGCDDSAGVAQFATQLDKLVFSSVAIVPSFDDKTRWPTWITTTILSEPTFKRFWQNLLALYRWKSFSIVCDVYGNSFYAAFAGRLYQSLMDSSQKYDIFRAPCFNSSQNVDYANLLRNVSSVSRVIFFFGQATGLRAFMTAAQFLNMTTDDYVYIAFTTFRHISLGIFTWQSDEKSSIINEARKEAFKSLLMIESDRWATEANDELTNLWKRKSSELYNYTYAPGETVSPHGFSTYSAMLILAEIMEEYRQTGREKIIPGRELAKKFLNRTFNLRTGQVRIDGFGQRVPTMILSQTDVDTGEITSILTQDAASGQLKSTGKIQYWTGNAWPVASQPRCGFLGNAPICQQQDSTTVTAVSTSVIVILAILLTCAAFIVIRKYDKDHQSWWLLSPELLKVFTGHARSNYSMINQSRYDIHASIYTK